VRRAPLFVVLVCGVLALGATASAQDVGWKTYDLGAGHRAVRYLPPSVRACDALPLVVFFHGSGGSPEGYEATLQPDADALGLVLLLPQATTSAGWNDADAPVINAALDAVKAELLVDDTREYTAGHSAGGALAYVVGIGEAGWAAVFTLSAPYYVVAALGDPSYAPPIHMYYGDGDPNWTGGSHDRLVVQWDRLGVTHETDLQAGYGHSTWPASSITAGLTFLAAHRKPGTPPASRCPDADAGVVDAGLDAAAVPDAGAELDAAARDASSASPDGGRSVTTGGCGCSASGVPVERSAAAVVFALVLVCVRRRAR